MTGPHPLAAPDLVMCASTCPQDTTCRRSRLVTQPTISTPWDHFTWRNTGCPHYLPPTAEPSTDAAKAAMAIDKARME